jgi:probable addiction module antidote protein
MSGLISYDERKLERLKDAEYAKAYLNASLEAYREDGCHEALLLALRDIAEAQGGVPEIARRINKPKQSVYKILSERGNPRLDTLAAVLDALGFHLSIEPAALRQRQ